MAKTIVQTRNTAPNCKASSVHRYPLLCHKKMVSHLHSPLPNINRLGPVVQKVDSAIQGIAIYPGPVVRTPVSTNLRLNFNPGFFFLLSKALSRIIFFILFRVSNHQIVGKEN